MKIYYLAICPLENLKIPFDKEVDRDKWALGHETSGPGHTVWVRDEDVDTGLIYTGVPPYTHSEKPVKTIPEADRELWPEPRDFAEPHRPSGVYDQVITRPATGPDPLGQEPNR